MFRDFHTFVYALFVVSMLALLLGLAFYSARAFVRRLRLKKQARIFRDLAPVCTFQKAFAFLVEIDGFSSLISGKVVGLVWGQKFVSNLVTVSRGFKNFPWNGDLIAWYQSGEARNVTIRMLSRDGAIVGVIQLGKCQPIRYFLSDFDNNSDECLTESMTFELASDVALQIEHV